MIIGITGCPGSGKTVLARAIADHGWELVDVDDLGRAVVENDPAVLAELAAVFGGDIIRPDGALDRRLVAAQAFASREATDRLNLIVHPRLVARLEERIRELRRDEADAVVDCALIFEWDIGDRFDLVVTVAAAAEFRHRRLIERDGRSAVDAGNLAAAQLPQDEKVRRADIVVNNNGATDRLRRIGALLAETPRFFDITGARR